MMFNGRLNKNESDVWLDLQEETSGSKLSDRVLAKKFLDLPESISFVSSVDKNIIGGTTIYRDRTRLSMVLVSVVVNEVYRDSATYQIIKASLPFFKTVAIRDVDVLISSDGSADAIGFPLSFEVPSWTYDVIKRIGFDEVAKIGQYSFDITEEGVNQFQWDERPNHDGAKELIWDQSKPMGLTTSLVWAARDFAAAHNNLVTIEVNEKVVAVAGLWFSGETLTVSPLVTDPEILEWVDIVELISSEGTRRGAKEINLPLMGEGQSTLIVELEKTAHLSSSRILTLLRKSL
jgi:hypothetical protein